MDRLANKISYLETRVAKLERKAKTPQLDMETEYLVVEDINNVFDEDIDENQDVYVEDYGQDSSGDIIFLCVVEDEDYYAIVIEPKRTKDQYISNIFSRKSDALRSFKRILRD